MRNTQSGFHGTSNALTAIPNQQEIDQQIAQARRAQSAGLRQLVAGTFAALDRRFHHTNPATD